MGENGQFHTPVTSLSEKELHQYPLNKRLDGPQSECKCYKEKEISCPCKEFIYNSLAVKLTS
jgi:hypothetical protein